MKNVIRAMYVVMLLLFALNCDDDDPIQYQLRTEASPEEGGSVSPASAAYNKGTEVEIKATANDEYAFKNWSGDASGNENPMKILMTDDMVITAVFEKVQYALTIEIVGEGTVNQEVVLAKSSSKDYESGTTVQLTAVPDAEWRFVEWSGDYTGTENPIQLTMDQAMTLTAKFEKVSYALTMEIQGNGTVNEEIIQAKSTTDYKSGTIVQLTAIPDAGWVFVEWSGDLQGSENPAIVTIGQTMSIMAKFLPESLEKIYVPDDNFEQALIDLGYDDVLDDYVYAESIKYVEELSLQKKQIKDLTGIEGFVNLQKLEANNNELTSVIFTGNEFLDQINLYDNKLTELDISALGFLKILNIYNNSLSCVTVNETQLNQPKWSDQALWGWDLGVYFSLDCSAINENKTYIPDNNFEKALIDLGHDDVLDNYVKTVDILYVDNLNISNKNISDLTGLEDFKSLITLDASNNNISSIDPFFGSSFGYGFICGTLILSDNNLSSLDISSLHILVLLDVRNNPLTCIQVNENQLSVIEDDAPLIPMEVKKDEGVIISLDCGN